MSQTAFAFGKNWRRYLRGLDEERVRIAQVSIADLFGDLLGASFLDVGCGSGLFSLAAFRLGAERVVSFDVDPDSVDCCRELWAHAAKPVRWQVMRGSALDPGFMTSLGIFDVVYAYGVLHHTGNMCAALEQVCGRVAPGGRLCVSLYNRVGGWKGSRTWAVVKRLYNRAPGPLQFLLTASYAGLTLVAMAVRGSNPIRLVGGYRRNRGMSWWTDVRDWIGGYPYEFAAPREVLDRVHSLGYGLELVRLEAARGLGNNTFVFVRR